MAKPEPHSDSGAFTRVLFVHVPNTIDVLWHWSELIINRLGSVQLQAPWQYQARPAPLSPLFVLVVLISWFMTFGPTSDSLCTAIGLDNMTSVRAVMALGLVLSGGAFLSWCLNRMLKELARCAEKTAEDRLPNDEQRERYKHNVEQVHQLIGSVMQKMPLLKPRSRESIAQSFRLLAAIMTISSRYATAYVVGAGMLAAGLLIVLAPLAYITFTLLSSSPDDALCGRGSAVAVVGQFAAFAVAVTMIAGAWLVRGDAWQRFLINAVVWVVLIGVLWGVVAVPQASESTGGPYPHVYVLVVAAFLIAIGFAKWLAPRLFRSVVSESRKAFSDALGNTELLTYKPAEPDIHRLQIFSAFITGVSQHLGHWLLLPALAVFVAPAEYVVVSAIGFAVLSTGLVLYGNLSSRWHQMLMLIRQWYLVGTLRIVSYAVIAIAFIRLAGVQYATTVMDAAPTGVLLVLVIMAYAVSWYYEIWISRWLGETLLELLGRREDAVRGWLEQTLDPDFDGHQRARNGRVLALHSPGRFCAQGYFVRTKCRMGERSPEYAFTSYSFAELFRVLDVDTAKVASNDIERRIGLYNNLVGLMLIAVFAGPLMWQKFYADPLTYTPVVSADAHAAPEPRNRGLGAALSARSTGDSPVIVVAASGGGTRAAVYTAVALEGLARLGLADDVSLLSGVSGGGVAVATFASRHQTLGAIAPSPQTPDNSWTQYVNAMGEPFVQDVMEGMGELRIVGPGPLGLLLKESLEQRLFSGPINTLGELDGIDLILNTTVTGHPQTDSELLSGRIAPGDGDNACEDAMRPFTSLAGGRLIFTNIANVEAFAPSDLSVPDMNLPYTLIRDPDVPLAAAGALTANFPPVFSNARVEVTLADQPSCQRRSYFVTDGGATENLGLVSALMALDSAVSASEGSLPDVHVVAVEASAIGYDYSDDRGLGAAIGGAKERNNAGLTEHLIVELRQRLAERDSALHIHYLTLPVVFRSRGGFGTHWMFAPSIDLANPLLAEQPGWPTRFGRWLTRHESDKVALTRPQLLTLWRALYSPDGGFCTAGTTRPPDWSKGMRRTADWICGRDVPRNVAGLKPDWQVTEWDKLVETLK